MPRTIPRYRFSPDKTKRLIKSAGLTVIATSSRLELQTDSVRRWMNTVTRTGSPRPVTNPLRTAGWWWACRASFLRTGCETITWTWVVTHTGDYGDVVTNTVEYDHSDSGQSGDAEPALHGQDEPVDVVHFEYGHDLHPGAARAR